MKEYTVMYQMGSYFYHSKIWTSSSAAALYWVDKIGGYNAIIMEEKEVDE